MKRQEQPIRYLDVDDVTKLAQLRALLQKYKKADKKLSDKLRERLSQGYRCPKSGPYLVEMIKVLVEKIDWKESFLRYLITNVCGGDKKRAKRLLAEIGPVVERTVQKKLLPKINHAHEVRRAA